MKIILETSRCYLREMDRILDATNAFELNEIISELPIPHFQNKQTVERNF